LLRAGAVLLQEQMRARGRNHKRQSARTEAVETMAALEKWIKAQELACSPEELQQAKQAARRQLDEIFQSLARLQEAQLQPGEARPMLERVLLLYRPTRFSGWLARLLFYAVLLFAVFMSIGIWADFKGAGDIGIMVAFYLACAVVILPVHAWAVSSDTPRIRLEG
jgi:hypothetical protein